tara:strand:+ start:448 stop:915 length:468 start_codon:yes stop_codon:yes gene_type:complete
MNAQVPIRGAASVGTIRDLNGIEAASVLYLRLWCDGAAAQQTVRNEFAATLGEEAGQRALRNFEQLFALCREHGRRPLMRHGLDCQCLGADEACFARFIDTAATGEREDAMLIATLLVRVDMAPLITALAADVGHAFLRMRPESAAPATPPRTLH